MKKIAMTTMSMLSLFVVASTPAFAASKDQRPSQQQEQALQQQAAKKEAANEFADQQLPLTEEEIRAVKKKTDGLRRAYDEPANLPPPRPVTSTITVDLTPGATPPLVRPKKHEGATISFIDTTGKPWPIFNDVNHASDLFAVSRPVPNGHIMTITALGNYGQGNITVLLKDLETPIAITLVLGQPEADYRIDMKIPMLGPNSEATTIRKGGSNSSMAVGDFNPILHAFLDDLPPADAKKIKITGVHQTKGWAFENKLYVRSSLQPISAYRDRQMGTGNVGVYVFEPTPLLLFSDNGSIVKALVEWGD